MTGELSGGNQSRTVNDGLASDGMESSTAALDRKQISRRAAAARRLVLARLKAAQPDLYAAWLTEAYDRLDADGRVAR